MGHIRDQLLHHDVEHGSGGEAQQIRHGRDDQPRRQHGYKAEDRLHRAGEDAVQKGFPLACAFRVQRHGNDSAFREVLDRDTQGQGQRAPRRDLRGAGTQAGIDDAHRHALGNVVERHRQHHHGGPGQPAFRSLGLAGVPVQMRDHMVQQEQEPDAQPEADESRQKGPASHAGGLLHRRDQQTPDRGRHHDARRKAAERLLYALAEGLPHEEHAACAEGRPEEGDQQADQYRFHLRPNRPFFS